MADFSIDSILAQVQAATGADDRRGVYMETLFDWGDNYSENLAAVNDSEESVHARKAISDLWLSYAAMEIALGEHGNAKQVFSDALEDQAASLVAATYIQSAAYYLETDKVGGVVEAAKVYSAGLKKSGMAADELSKLQAAQSGITGAVIKMEVVNDDDLFTATAGDEYKKVEASATADHFLAEMMRIHSSNSGSGSTDEGDDDGTSTWGALANTDGLTPELIVKKFYRRPSLVFECGDVVTLSTTAAAAAAAAVSQRGSNTTGTLDAADSAMLQSYLGTDAIRHEGIIDILQAMWITQAVTESTYSGWYAELNQAQRKELKIRDAAVGASAAEAVDDRTRARNRCAVQKEVLSAIVNKSMWTVAQEQHRTLIRIGFPGFSLSTLDSLEAHLFGSSNSNSSSSNNSSSVGGGDGGMGAQLSSSLQRQRAFVAVVLASGKGKGAGKYLDGTLPVAAKVDPRLARKRRFQESSASSAPALTKVSGAPSSSVASVKLEQSKPTTLAGKAKVMPAPDAAAIAKLAEQEMNPPKKTRARKKA
jgi:hypothetical protein